MSFNDDFEPVLIDFGHATPLPFALQPDNPLYVCGTPGYIAPEVAYQMIGLSGEAIDYFALGISLFFMCEGALPFFDKDNPVNDVRYQLL